MHGEAGPVTADAPHDTSAGNAQDMVVCWICFEPCSIDDAFRYCGCQVNCHAHEACVVGWSTIRQRCRFCDSEWRLPSSGDRRRRPSPVAERQIGEFNLSAMAIGASIFCYLQLGIALLIYITSRNTANRAFLTASGLCCCSALGMAGMLFTRHGVRFPPNRQNSWISARG